MRYIIVLISFMAIVMPSLALAQPRVENIPLDNSSSSCVQAGMYRDRFNPSGYETEYTHQGSGETYMNYGMTFSDRCGGLEIKICSVRVSGEDPNGRHEWSCVSPTGSYTDIHDVGSVYAIYCSRSSSGCSSKISQAVSRISSSRTTANSMEIARLASPLRGQSATSNAGSAGGRSASNPRANSGGSQNSQLASNAAGNSKYSQSKSQRTNSQRLYPPNNSCLWVDVGRQIINRCTNDLEANWIDTGGHGNMWTIPGGRSYAATNVKRLVACQPNDGFDWNRNMCRD